MTDVPHQPIFRRVIHVVQGNREFHRAQACGEVTTFLADGLDEEVAQLGCQRFFTANGRPFCLYVVAGSRAYLPRIVREVNEALAGLDVSP